MAPKSKNKNEGLTEDDRLCLNKHIDIFVNHSEEKTLVFPSNLRKIERKYLFEYVRKYGLTSKSHTVKGERSITIYKMSKDLPIKIHEFEFKPKSRQYFEQLAKQNKLPQLYSLPKLTNILKRSENIIITRPLSKCIPQKLKKIPPQFLEEKKELPICKYRQCILDAIQSNSIIIVNGETGSGKSTQLPQYILEEKANNREPCRIICTQPRRVAAVSVSSRVANERGEQLGHSVGYQIRLKSCVSQFSNLIYTTSGCVLRAITANETPIFQNISHLIIDEIHERDKNTDFILISVKKYLKKNKNLKVILMSATMDINQLSAYFDNCPVIIVPGKTYEIATFYLEDILLHSEYMTSLMQKFYKSMEFDCSTKKPPETENTIAIDNSTQELIDMTLDNIYKNKENSGNDFMQLLYLMESENAPVDVAHTKSLKTPLIAAVECNDTNYADKFLQLGADKYITDINGESAVSYAKYHKDQLCSSLLEKYESKSSLSEIDLDETSKKKKMLLLSYQMQFNDEDEVDHDLIFSLIEGIYQRKHPGAIMVFFPGYSDIITQREYIESTLPSGTYELFILHSNMNTVDQENALKPCTQRKIILSTNIGQTSITIPDLAFVIDSGKVKMITFDSNLNRTQLRTVWISQACANQRSGRSGRTQNGICYRLYSKKKYLSMSEFCLPEFVRISLAEICLLAKTIDSKISSEEYLSQALNPPTKLNIQNAVKMLKTIDVFDDNECVTELGKHLVNLPFDVQLGKVLLYAIFFKCVRPILTIVTFHSVKDPFILPSERSDLGKASVRRKTFSMDSFSDHIVILNLYSEYKKVQNNRNLLNQFCSQNFVSKNLMEIFHATRAQTYQQISQIYRCSDENSNDWNIVRMCLIGGLYPNVAIIDRDDSKLISKIEKNLIVNQGSALRPPGKKKLKEYIDDIPYDFVTYFEKSIFSNMGCIHYNTLLPSIMIALMYGHNYTPDATIEESDDDDDYDDDGNDNNKRTTNGNGNVDGDEDSNGDNKTDIKLKYPTSKVSMALDEWLMLYLSKNDKEMILVLRKTLQNMFSYFLRIGHRNETNSIITSFIYMLKKILKIESPAQRELLLCLNNAPYIKKQEYRRGNGNFEQRNSWRSRDNFDQNNSWRTKQNS